MNFLWILAGFAPGALLYLVYLSKKKYDKTVKIFKDFWASFVSWVIAGGAAFTYSIFRHDTTTEFVVFLATGIVLNIIGTMYAIEQDKNNKAKHNKNSKAKQKEKYKGKHIK